MSGELVTVQEATRRLENMGYTVEREKGCLTARLGVFSISPSRVWEKAPGLVSAHAVRRLRAQAERRLL